MTATADVRLKDRLDAVRRALSTYLGIATAAAPGAASSERPDDVGGLATLSRRCGLSPFEVDVLVLVAGCELDADLAEMCARVHGDPTGRYATFGLALRVLGHAHWDALGVDGPLRALALIDLDRRAGGLTLARLRIDERVLLQILGLDSVDEGLSEVALVSEPADLELPSRHAQLLAEALDLWSVDDRIPLVLRGSSASDRESFVRALAHRGAAPRIWTVTTGLLPTAAGEQADLLRRLARESRLTGSPVVLEVETSDPGQLIAARRFAHRLAEVAVRVVVLSAEPVNGLPAGAVTFDLPEPTMAESVDLWRSALGPVALSLNGHVERLAGQFRLPADHVRAVAAGVAVRIADPGSPPALPSERLAKDLWSACRVRARADLDGLAECVIPSARWSDLVLPPREVEALNDLLRHARNRATVYEHWQVSGATRRGAGVSALFTGPSGTGKSLAAEVIAGELEVDLYRVDLSQVVNKYIGETEKNLRRVFDAAERSGAVLVIDEADALFGQRSEVKDSHDRYANIEVSYLLQRMESYRGLAVLTTNLRAHIDEAFVRRLGFIVTFPFPDSALRRALWERAFGPRVPVDALDPSRLAQLNLAGGSIRNVAVHAAFLAAERGSPVTMADLLHGARSEYDKLDHPLTPSELAGWAQ